MKTSFLLAILLFCSSVVRAQTDTSKAPIDYSFVLQDSPAKLFTMRQVNQSYLSGYRLFARGLNSAVDNERVSDFIQLGLEVVFLMPLTHEEGHRSILTVNNIGSISQPYFNEHGAAYVVGVTDQTLKQLRDTDLPTYIRLHTAGLESDYMLTRRMEAIGSFDQDDFQYFKWEYWTRKLGILQYFVTGLFKYDIDTEEEANELERDIVGHDIYGATRHLYRPDMEFYRYTRYGDLTAEERDFVQRLGYRSLLNLLNPLLIGKSNFALSATMSINGGLGYAMAPFGDFIDENVWFNYRNVHVGFYARQFQNRDHWFNGFGLSLSHYQIFEPLFISLAGHFWQQPDQLNFDTAKSFTGGAIDTELSYFFAGKGGRWLDAFSINLGLLYKTKGFLPEELYLNEHFGIRFGTTLRL